MANNYHINNTDKTKQGNQNQFEFYESEVSEEYNNNLKIGKNNKVNSFNIAKENKKETNIKDNNCFNPKTLLNNPQNLNHTN